MLLSFLLSFFLFFDLQAQEPEESIVDSTHRQLSSSLFSVSNKLDSFFGGERADDLPNNSRFRLLINFNKEESIPYKGKGAVRLNISLIETQKKLKVSFKNRYEKEHSGEIEKVSEPRTEVENEIQNEIQSEEITEVPNDFFHWRLKLDSGIQLDIPPDPYLRLRALKSWFFGAYELRPNQQIFYYLKSGAGETTRLDLDRPLSENILLRYENDVTWTDTNDKFIFFAGPILFHKFGDIRGISYSAKVVGESKPTWHVNDYRLEVSYRREILRRWFFLDVNPYIHFPKERKWESTLGFNVRFELVVGQY